MALALSLSYAKWYPFKRCNSMPNIMPSEYSRVGVGNAVSEKKPREKFMGNLEIEEKLEDVIALENETALFECKVAQDLNPICTWYKNGIALQTDDERVSVIRNSAWYRLEIKKVTVNDQGIYTLECKHKQQYIRVKGHLYVGPQKITDGVFYYKSTSKSFGVIKQLQDIRVLEGGKIELEANFSIASNDYVWYKNNDVVPQDQRISIQNWEHGSFIEIVNARPTDAGVYFLVARTDHGFLSSFADVQINDRNEIIPTYPFIEEYFPEDVEAELNEEMRLVLKVHTDENTIIKWEKNNIELRTNSYYNILDYGSNYIGLSVPRPDMGVAGEYRLSLRNSVKHRVVIASAVVTVTQSESYPEVGLLRPLLAAVACCGAKVSFNCQFDLKDPVYFYVVWYIGHYRVERTNSHFNVICNGGQFLLYIDKLEPSMAGLVICELRRIRNNHKSVCVGRSYARLVIVPRTMILEEKLLWGVDGKLYYDESDDDGTIITVECGNGRTANPVALEEAKYMLKVVYCRLDEGGLYFTLATCGTDSEITSVRISDSTVTSLSGSMNVVFFKWNSFADSDKYWYIIELLQSDGTYVPVGTTSQPQIAVENPPLERMMIFRIGIIPVDPMSDIYDSEIYITPPSETVLRQAIPYEIQSIDSFNAKYELTSELIGTGAYGSVKLVKDKADGAFYAAKIVKTKVQRKKEYTIKEFHIMKELRHPKLIELIGFYELVQKYIFVMEFCWGGELFDRVVGEEYLKEVDVVGYVKQICEGLEYMHEKSIVHLDLKPENIICMSPNSRQVKLIDFGLARNVNDEAAKSIYGTRDYVSPEILDYEPISTATDMWSVGVVTYTLLSGVMPFAGESWVERSINISRARYDYDDYAFDEVSDLARTFVDNLLIRRPAKRMTAADALQHKWIIEGPPRGTKAKHMHKMQRNLKSYLADYRARWKRAGRVMIAARRLRMRQRPESASTSFDGTPPELASDEEFPDPIP